MTSEVLKVAEPSVTSPATVSSDTDLAGAKSLRVFLFDLLPTVPYYTGHLAAALSQVKDVEVVLGSPTYAHDPTFFRNMGLNNAPGMLDISAQVKSSSLRRAVKLVEYLLNLAVCEGRFWRQKPDVIHVQFTPLLERRLPFEIWFLRAARALGIKLVYTVHNLLPHENAEQLRSSYADLYKLMDGFICHDYSTKERLVREFEVDRRKVSVIPHGPLVSGATESGQPRKQETRTGKPVVLWQGIIRPYKGLPFFLHAWQKAMQAGLEAQLVIVGTGEQQLTEEIRQLVRSLNLESSVRLDFRFVSTEELTSHYDSADIVVYPYSDITTSGALMMGIGHRKAMIASDLPAFRLLLKHNRNALLVPHGDLTAWSDALLLLTSNVDLRARFSQLLSQDCANLPDWNAIARDTVQTYRNL
jgi:glycosyltransferase involved in cell wall biosynthesis